MLVLVEFPEIAGKEEDGGRVEDGRGMALELAATRLDPDGFSLCRRVSY